MLLVIVLVVSLCIVYFACFSGNTASLTETAAQVENPAPEDAEVIASVKGKYAMAGARGTVLHVVVFVCDDGVEREFALDEGIFDALYINQRDTLIYSGTRFLGFGPYGGIDIDGEEAFDLINANDFSYDDFDERIDIEQRIEPAEKDDTDALSAADKEALERFLDYGKLPPKSETVSDEPDTFARYQTEHLLQKLTNYPFLKRESQIVRMFERVYADALEDMRGYDGDSRRGMAADDVLLNGNEIRLVITVQEAPSPLRCSVTAELGVND